MNRDFERTHAAMMSSAFGRAFGFLGDAIKAAWRASSTGRMARACRRAADEMPATTQLQTVAVAVAIAAALQPLLILTMPATVMPAMPWFAFVAIAIFAATIAYRAPAFIKAWPTSAPARLFRR